MTVEESAGIMRQRKIFNPNSMREKSGYNDTTRSRNFAINETHGKEEKSYRSAYNDDALSEVLKKQIYVVIVAITAVLFVFLGGGPDTILSKETNSTISITKNTNETAGFSPKPRVVHYILASNSVPDPSKMPFAYIDRILVEDLSEDESGVRLSDSEEYGKKPEPRYTNDPPCEPQYKWQEQNLQVCNIVHESDMTDFLAPTDDDTSISNDSELFRFIASGGYRDVYMIRDRNSSRNKLALKTLKWSREFTERHFDRHRRDAIVADRLTATSRSVDIYGFCGQSAIYEFAKGGDLRRAIQKCVINPSTADSAWNSTQKLTIAYQIAASLADVHNVDMEGRASIAHTDISTGQFISIDGDDNFKINDFNRARLLRKNSINNTVCPFHVKSNKGKFRSPEEYLYHAETEKIDVYSMGNIFWVLLHGMYPFEKISRKATKRAVSKGQRPVFEASLMTSDDTHIQALITATKMCWAQDPEKRASAREIQHYLETQQKQ